MIVNAEVGSSSLPPVTIKIKINKILWEYMRCCGILCLVSYTI